MMVDCVVHASYFKYVKRNEESRREINFNVKTNRERRLTNNHDIVDNSIFVSIIDFKNRVHQSYLVY